MENTANDPGVNYTGQYVYRGPAIFSENFKRIRPVFFLLLAVFFNYLDPFLALFSF